MACPKMSARSRQFVATLAAAKPKIRAAAIRLAVSLFVRNLENDDRLKYADLAWLAPRKRVMLGRTATTARPFYLTNK